MKNLCLGALLLFSATLQAESGWTNYGKVIELIPDSDFRYRVKINVVENPSGCRNDSWFYQDYLSNGSQQMFSALLEALIHNLKVKVYVNGKCGFKGYSEISAVSIKS